MATRSVLHVDMDAFYASVEQRDNPELKGQPVVVGGGVKRGVVAAASYEAREYGIRSAMPMATAMRRCNNLVRIKPRMQHYKDASAKIFSIFRSFTPLVEGLSLDEAFLDVSASVTLFGSPERIAIAIKQRILDETWLTASVGVAENKLVAKIASDLDKPDGLTVIDNARRNEILDPLPVAVIPGVGRQKLKRLDDLGIATVGALRDADVGDLRSVFGKFATAMQARAAGVDDREVIPRHTEKSVSAEETFETDLTDTADLDRELLRLADRTSARLRKAGLSAGTVQIKIRSHDFTTCTRQCTVQPATNGTDQIFRIAKSLLETWLQQNPGARIRLLGVGGTELAAAGQRDLFAAQPAGSAATVDATVDEIREKFGSIALGRARTLERR